jgi:hypothetical protein
MAAIGVAPGKMRAKISRFKFSNSQPSVFSRRNASEVCQSLAIRTRGDGAAGGARMRARHPWRRD